MMSFTDDPSDQKQYKTAGHTDIGDVEHRKMHELQLEHIDDVAVERAVDAVAEETGEQQRAAVSANEAAQLQQIKDAGVIVCEDPDITSFQEATAELYLRPEVQAIVSPELTEMVRSAAEAAAK